ncbi:MAG: glutamine-hydrolyzing GMP synthase [candidate division WOR-3 bacterium]
MDKKGILIVDFGSQYTQLIARRIRELEVFSEIVHPDGIKDVELKNYYGLILSGGPNSVYDRNSPDIKLDLVKLDIPVLGICYGMQLLAKKYNGKVERSKKREFGFAKFNILKGEKLFKNIPKQINVWMSHSDNVVKLPDNFYRTGYSHNCKYGSMESKNGKIFGLQFHPEVYHTEYGKEILKNFVFEVCGAKKNWTSKHLIKNIIENIQEEVGDGYIIGGLSGGVDSTVAAVLVKKAIGNRLKGFLIDTGLLRMNEGKEVIELYNKKLKLNVKYVDKSKVFLKNLKGVTDPEKKRKIIGKLFIESFEDEAKKIKNAKFLLQGTIYPDRIESKSTKGPSAVIKSHHNVGGLPERMNFKLIEPLKDLFKDEVRTIGLKLGIPSNFISRHPFPGPGLAIRIIGEVTEEKLEILRKVDAIYIEELKKNKIYDEIWQAFAVFLPVQSVGVMGDERTYENVIALRAVTSTDGMTADFYWFEREIIQKISNRIINEVKGVNRVVYDISSKPPSTIEWE